MVTLPFKQFFKIISPLSNCRMIWSMLGASTCSLDIVRRRVPIFCLPTACSSPVFLGCCLDQDLHDWSFNRVTGWKMSELWMPSMLFTTISPRSVVQPSTRYYNLTHSIHPPARFASIRFAFCTNSRLLIVKNVICFGSFTWNIYPRMVTQKYVTMILRLFCTEYGLSTFCRHHRSPINMTPESK